MDMATRQEAEIMLWELLERQLEVVLTPAPEKRHACHCVRTVCNQNAEWYRRFCALYPSSRAGKLRTRIKRRETVAALEQIVAGEAKATVYQERLLRFIERRLEPEAEIERDCVYDSAIPF